MSKYVLQRVVLLIPTLFVIVFIVFSIMELTPSDPGTLLLGERASPEDIARKNEELGYNRPFLVRYMSYMSSAFRGDLGKSWRTGRPVFAMIVDRLPVTATLALGAVTVGLVVGVTIGVLSAVKQYSVLDISATTVAMALASFPGFWVGMVLIIIFSLWLRVLPSYGVGTIKHFVLPWLASSCTLVASMLRMTRTSMLESIRMDYIRTARAKGQTERLVIWRHALRNALLPLVTVAGLNIGVMLGGTVTVESVFSLHGVGSLVIEAIRSKDMPVVLGSTVTLATCFTLVMLVVDILYAFIDPRLRTRYVRVRSQ
jgi:peptide/nickel transport system permease protein